MDLPVIADNRLACKQCGKLVSKANMSKHIKVCTGKKDETHQKKKAPAPVHPLDLWTKYTKEELQEQVCQDFQVFMKSRRNHSKKTWDTYTWKVKRFLETKSMDVSA